MYDLIIIGMGPCGMSAGVYAKKANLDVLLLEASIPGGAILKAKKIDNYLGFSNVDGSDLALNMFKHINDLNISYKIENVLKIEEDEKYLKIITNKDTYKAKTALITTGKSINKLIINNKALNADNISYCTLCDGYLYKNKDVVLIKDNEEDNEVLYLKNIVKNLTILKKEEIKDIIIKENLVKEIKTTNKNIKLDGLFVSKIENNSTQFDKNLNIRKNNKIIVDKNYKTKKDRIYAAGDVIKKDVYQICNAVSEGAEAVVNIIKYLGDEK